MKNISPAKTDNNDTKKTIILFVVFFLISEFFIIKPLRKKLENKQRELREEELLLQNEEKNKSNDVFGEDVIVENDYLKLKINTKGLKIDDVILKKYTINVDSDENVKLLNNKYFIDINWLSFTNGAVLPDNNSLWNSERDGNKTIFSYDNGDGIIFKIALHLDDKYMLNVEQVVENNKYEKLYLKPVWQITKIQDSSNTDLTGFNGGVGVFNNKLEEIKNKKVKNKNIEFEKFDWAGLTSKYWLTAIINEDKTNGTVNYVGKNNRVKLQYTTKNNLIIAKNSFAGTKNKIFIGAKDLDILKEYRDNDGVALFDRSIDFGLFYILSKPLNSILNFFNKVTNNFGLAIILLTVIIKILLYPTIRNSFVSMAKMKKVQPELKRLQEKYKDDRVALQQEVVKLYKKYELNPLSSIIPIFVQIPVFFSLYKVISVSLKMRQAPFFGYIKDLSIADQTTIFNLFGLLNYNVSYKIGLLPCIMALTMYIQQKVTENMSGDGKVKMDKDAETANKMGKYLPLLFLFMFSGFPAGLLLYWTFNNIITLLQQLYISKKYMNK
ncbi:MAG: membrane protein insertase YidC [Rickettsiales bacterium]|nr:membrane protein insertase YidC [Rickettsiales bacterium]